VSSEIVTVCLDGVAGRDYVDALVAALARYGEDSDDQRWTSQWRLYGGDDGLPVLAAHTMDASVVMVDGVCAGAPRGLLDLDGA